MSKKKLHNRKAFIISTAIVVILAIAAVVIWRTEYNGKTTSYIATKSYPAENDLNNARKASSTPAKTLDNGPSVSTTGTSQGSVTITRAGVNNSELQVGTLLSGITSGTCTLSVSQTGETTVTSVDQVILQNNSYVCTVFSIPASQFPNQGNWNVSVTVTSGNNTVTNNWTSNPVDLTETL